jgi:hypothetical protein
MAAPRFRQLHAINPRPAKPASIIAQVEGSGADGVTDATAISETPLSGIESWVLPVPGATTASAMAEEMLAIGVKHGVVAFAPQY